MVLNVFKREKWQKAVLYHNKYKNMEQPKAVTRQCKEDWGVVQSVKGVGTEHEFDSWDFWGKRREITPKVFC